MGFSVNSLQVETITPEKAAEFLGMNYAKQRKLRQSWVEYLAREMREGRFMSTAEVHIMYRNGDPVMVNGQHTCSAIVAYGKPVRVTVRKTTTHEVGQIAMAYAFGHDSGIRRTFTDGMNAYDLTEQTGLPSEAINRIVGAIRFIRMGFNAHRIGGANIKDSPADMVNSLLGTVPVMKMFHAFVMPCDKKFLRRLRVRSVLSVGLLTFHYQPEKAAQFWSQVALPDSLPWNDARVTARRYIEMNETQDRAYEAITARRVARCWRAFCEDSMLQQVQKVDALAPISIYGTDYTGRQSMDFFPFELSLPAQA